MIWNLGDATAPQELKSWSSEDLSKLKTVTSSEKDPVSGMVVAWKGPLLSAVIEKALEELTPERKAQIDLIILKSASGVQASVPRALITKYPVVLGRAKGKGPLTIVMPWTSRPKLKAEELPVETYFISNVSRIELSGYRERYASFFLKRRTDPGAIRGETLFVKNCVGCHTSGGNPGIADLSGDSKARKLASAGHPEVKGTIKLGERERRAVVSYLDAYRGEHAAITPSDPTATGTSQAQR